MKTIISALIALSVLAGIAAPASAFDGKNFYDQQERRSYCRRKLARGGVSHRQPDDPGPDHDRFDLVHRSPLAQTLADA